MPIIICVRKKWKHYVKNFIHMMTIIINHVNLKMFLLNKNLFEKKMKWWKKLFNFDLIIKYKSEKQNFANAASRRSDYEIKNVKKKKILKNIKIKISNFSKTTLLTVSVVESEIGLCAECWIFINVVFTNVLNPDSLVMRRSSESEIDEILSNNFTNNKTSLKNIVHAYISIIDWIFCGLSTNDSIESSILKKIRS